MIRGGISGKSVCIFKVCPPTPKQTNKKTWKKCEMQKNPSTQISTDFKAKKIKRKKPLCPMIFIFFLKCPSPKSIISKAGRIFPESNKNVYSKTLFSYGKKIELMFVFFKTSSVHSSLILASTFVSTLLKRVLWGLLLPLTKTKRVLVAANSDTCMMFLG